MPDTTPSSPTGGSKRLRIDRSPGRRWRVTFVNPPINLIDGPMMNELLDLVDELEASDEVCAVVFDSADDEFFLAHFDVVHTKGAPMQRVDTRLSPWLDVTTRLSRLPVVSIAAVRGRARGAGSEFVLACDLRFASIERAILSQPEVGVGMVPGGGPMYRLPGLVGRGRALEILLASEDINASIAETYGYVNRAVPDDQLDVFVDTIAARIAGFNKAVIAETKHFVDEVTLGDEEELLPATSAAFWQSVSRPATQERMNDLLRAGFQQRGSTERDLGAALGPTTTRPLSKG